MKKIALLLTLFVAVACSNDRRSASPTEPLPPAIPQIAGNYTIHLSFLCKTNQDLPTIADETITIRQSGSTFTADLPRNGVLHGTLTATSAAVEVTYTFGSPALSVTAANGSLVLANGNLQGIAFIQGTASQCEFGSFAIRFEKR